MIGTRRLPWTWAAITGSALLATVAIYAVSTGRAQTCTDYAITVLAGEAAFTSEFLYRVPGQESMSLKLTTDNVGSDATVRSAQPIEFGIYVYDQSFERWTPRIQGQEIWFED